MTRQENRDFFLGMKIGNITEQRWEIGKVTLKGFFLCLRVFTKSSIWVMVGEGDH